MKKDFTPISEKFSSDQTENPKKEGEVTLYISQQNLFSFEQWLEIESESHLKLGRLIAW